MKEPVFFDVLIVGAGLVGASVAVGLRTTQLKIALLEKSVLGATAHQVEDARPLSLAYGSRVCLSRWNSWSALSPSAVPIKTVHVSEQGRLGRVQFSAKDYGLPALAYVVPYSLLHRQLLQQIADDSQAHLKETEELDSIECSEEGVQVNYWVKGQRRKLIGKLLLVADGLHSRCRDLLGIGVTQEEAQRIALAIQLRCQGSSAEVAYQRFSKVGSLAVLPALEAGTRQLIWTMSEAQYEAVSTQTDQVLQETVQEVYGERLPAIERIQRQKAYPVVSMAAHAVTKPSVVLLGQAAYALYPLTAQGFNLNLQDVSVLVQTIQRAQQQGQALNAPEVISRYLRRRREEQQRMRAWTQRITSAFSWQLPAVGALRGFSLLGLDLAACVKDYLARNFLHA